VNPKAKVLSAQTATIQPDPAGQVAFVSGSIVDVRFPANQGSSPAGGGIVSKALQLIFCISVI